MDKMNAVDFDADVTSNIITTVYLEAMFEVLPPGNYVVNVTGNITVV